MKRVLIQMQNYLFANAIEASFQKECASFEVCIAANDKELFDINAWFLPSVLLLEVAQKSSYSLPERLEIVNRLRSTNCNFKVVCILDETKDKALVEEVKMAKKDKFIDEFVFSSISASYLTAIIDGL